jgi:hypothetical protein
LSKTINDPIGILFNFDAYLVISLPQLQALYSPPAQGLPQLQANIHHAKGPHDHCQVQYDRLKTKGIWGAKPSNNEKIVAMTNSFNALKGLLKLDPKLSATAKEDNKDNNKGKQKKKKKNTNFCCEKKSDKMWKKEPPKEGDKNKKKVGKYTYHWCKHHMAWTVDKPTDCLLRKQHK